ncbi:hypothetical protein GCM10020255_011210 [Rhodococcus baikonurensis]
MKHSANRTRRVVTVAGAAVRATAALNGGAMTGVHSPGCPSLQSETVATDSADGRPQVHIYAAADAPVGWKPYS